MKPEAPSLGDMSPRTDPAVGARQGRYRPDTDGSAGLHAAERQVRFPGDPKRRASIRIIRRFSLSAERVFHAWLAPEIAGRWLFATASRPMAHVDIDPRVAGSFRFVDRWHDPSLEYRGEYVQIIPHRRLAFTLRSGDEPRAVTRVKVDLAALKQGCVLTLTHQRVSPDHAIRTRQRWIGILYGLGVTLDARPLDALPEHERLILTSP